MKHKNISFFFYLPFISEIYLSSSCIAAAEAFCLCRAPFLIFVIMHFASQGQVTWRTRMCEEGFLRLWQNGGRGREAERTRTMENEKKTALCTVASCLNDVKCFLIGFAIANDMIRKGIFDKMTVYKANAIFCISHMMGAHGQSVRTPCECMLQWCSFWCTYEIKLGEWRLTVLCLVANKCP